MTSRKGQTKGKHLRPEDAVGRAVRQVGRDLDHQLPVVNVALLVELFPAVGDPVPVGSGWPW